MPHPRYCRLPGSLLGEEKGSERTVDASTTTGDTVHTTCKDVHVHTLYVQYTYVHCMYSTYIVAVSTILWLSVQLYTTTSHSIETAVTFTTVVRMKTPFPHARAHTHPPHPPLTHIHTHSPTPSSHTYTYPPCRAHTHTHPPTHTHISSHAPHTSTGVSSYVLNDRLFPIPVHDCSDPEGSHCPTCEGKHKRNPSPTRYVRCVLTGIESGPAFITGGEVAVRPPCLVQSTAALPSPNVC